MKQRSIRTKLRWSGYQRAVEGVRRILKAIDGGGGTYRTGMFIGPFMFILRG